MCRGGRMFSPIRTWRRWHRKVNINQRRYAAASALAASAIPALVLARGHRISQVEEIPLVIDTEVIEPLTKTKAALELLLKLKVEDEVERCKIIKKHTGKARLRNRAKHIKVGPLIVTASKNATAYRAFRNLLGVQTTSVHALDLLKLAPGGHLGRFIIWTRAAFEQLDIVFGTFEKPSEVKKGYILPRPLLTNADLRRVLQAESVQTALSAKAAPFKVLQRTNNTKSKALERINPYETARIQKERELQKQKAQGIVQKPEPKPKSDKPKKEKKDKKDRKEGEKKPKKQRRAKRTVYGKL